MLLTLIRVNIKNKHSKMHNNSNRRIALIVVIVLIIIALIIIIALAISLKNNCNNNPLPTGTYNYIVVGLGAAGSVVAARLSQRDPNLKIAVIDASNDFTKNPYVTTPYTFSWLWDSPLYPPIFASPPYNPEYDEWSFKTTSTIKLYDVKNAYPRGVGKSGSGGHHALLPYRGDANTFNQWAAATGDSSWNFDSMLNYFKRSERNLVFGTQDFDKWHSNQGWLTMTRAEAQAVTIDVMKACMDGIGMPFVNDFLGDPSKIAGVGYYNQMVNEKGQRSNSGVDLFTPVATNNPNITFISNSLVTKLLYADQTQNCNNTSSTPTVNGVEYAEGKYTYEANTQFKEGLPRTIKQVYAINEVILCGGAINSPQILLLSGIGPKEELEVLNIPVKVDRKGVGKNLQDHLEIFINFELQEPYYIPQNTLNPFDILDPSQPEYQQLIACGKGALSTNVTPAGFDWFSGANPNLPPDQPDIHVQAATVYFPDFNIKEWIPLQQFNPSAAYQNFVSEVAHPVAPYGSITLKSNSPFDAPIVDELPLASDYNLEVQARSVMLIRSLWDQQVPIAYPPFSPPVTDTLKNKYGAVEALPTSQAANNIPALKQYIRENSIYGHHIACTCPMGKSSDPMAVVDSQLRVIGVNGLRIADASVMTTICGGNPCVVVYAIAEKAVDMIMASR